MLWGYNLFKQLPDGSGPGKRVPKWDSFSASVCFVFSLLKPLDPLPTLAAGMLAGPPSACSDSLHQWVEAGGENLGCFYFYLFI